jgi:hypothetical protein
MADDAGDAEMVHYETDDEDDVDTINTAKARPQQGSTVEIRSRRSFAGASESEAWTVKLRLRLRLDEELSCRTYSMRTRRGVMPSMDSSTFGQTGLSWLRRSTGALASKTGCQ